MLQTDRLHPPQFVQLIFDFADNDKLFESITLNLLSLWLSIFEHATGTIEDMYILLLRHTQEFLQGDGVFRPPSPPLENVSAALVDAADRERLALSFISMVILQIHRDRPLWDKFYFLLESLFAEWIAQSKFLRHSSIDRLIGFRTVIMSNELLKVSQRALSPPPKRPTAVPPKLQNPEDFLKYFSNCPVHEFNQFLASQVETLSPQQEFTWFSDWLIPDLALRFSRSFIEHVVMYHWFRLSHSISVERFSFAVLQFAAMFEIPSLWKWAVHIGRLTVYAPARCLPFLAVDLDRLESSLRNWNSCCEEQRQSPCSWQDCVHALLQESDRNPNFRWQLHAHVSYKYPASDVIQLGNFSAVLWLVEWLCLKGLRREQKLEMFHFAADHQRTELLSALISAFEVCPTLFLKLHDQADHGSLQGIFFLAVPEWNLREWKSHWNILRQAFPHPDDFFSQSMEIARGANPACNPYRQALFKILYVVLQLTQKTPFLLSNCVPYVKERAASATWRSLICMQRLFVLSIAVKNRALIELDLRLFAEKVAEQEQEQEETSGLAFFAAIFVFAAAEVKRRRESFQDLQTWLQTAPKSPWSDVCTRLVSTFL